VIPAGEQATLSGPGFGGSNLVGVMTVGQYVWYEIVEPGGAEDLTVQVSFVDVNVPNATWGRMS
jgi:hypothetical protein